MFTVINLSDKTISVDNLTLAAGASAKTKFITTNTQEAAAQGLVSISYASDGASNATGFGTLTDSTTGTASVTNTLVNVTAAFSQPVLNANFATLAVAIDQLFSIVGGLQTVIGDAALNPTEQ